MQPSRKSIYLVSSLCRWTSPHRIIFIWSARQFSGISNSITASQPIKDYAPKGRLKWRVLKPETHNLARLHQGASPGGPIWRQSELSSYIREVTEVTTDHLTPELRLHLVTPACALWSSHGDECRLPDPFWAFYWPGGQALTRYLLDNPAVVRGRSVLDVGSGCGASAIAACMSGAKHVTANDICHAAAEAMRMNAALNEVSFEINTQNLIGHSHKNYEVVLLGDMFYDQEFTDHVTTWLETLRSQGTDILIGDPGRVYFLDHPIKNHLSQVFSVDLLPHTMEENSGLTEGFVWKFN